MQGVRMNGGESRGLRTISAIDRQAEDVLASRQIGQDNGTRKALVSGIERAKYDEPRELGELLGPNTSGHRSRSSDN